MNQTLICALATFLLTNIAPAAAQQPAKIHKIGWLGATPPSSVSVGGGSTVLFWQEFRKFGYVEGKNIVTEHRNADNQLDRLPALAEELVRLKVDMIVTGGTNAALAAKKATTTIPIIMFNVSDPVADGLVDSLARPGGTSLASVSYLAC